MFFYKLLSSHKIVTMDKTSRIRSVKKLIVGKVNFRPIFLRKTSYISWLTKNMQFKMHRYTTVPNDSYKLLIGVPI